MTAVVGKGWAKGKSAIPVRGPSVAVVGTVKGKTEKSCGRWCIPDQAEIVGSGRQGRKMLRVISAKGRRVPEVVRKVRVGG